MVSGRVTNLAAQTAHLISGEGNSAFFREKEPFKSVEISLQKS
jgi:hypothetical protein